jgi:hypothetical protein
MPLTEKGNEILHNMEKTYSSPKKAEQVFYASRNAGTISGVDSVPLGNCYKDDVPPALLYGEPKISPTSTSQYSGMQEQLRTAPQPVPHEPIDAGNKTAGLTVSPSKNASEEELVQARKEMVERLSKTKEAQANRAIIERTQKERQRDSATVPQPSQPGHELAEAGAIERLEALHGRRSAPADFSGDANSPMGHLPAEISFADIRRMGTGFNYNQGYGGDPYNKK